MALTASALVPQSQVTGTSPQWVCGCEAAHAQHPPPGGSSSVHRWGGDGGGGPAGGGVCPPPHVGHQAGSPGLQHMPAIQSPLWTCVAGSTHPTAWVAGAAGDPGAAPAAESWEIRARLQRPLRRPGLRRWGHVGGTGRVPPVAAGLPSLATVQRAPAARLGGARAPVPPPPGLLLAHRMQARGVHETHGARWVDLEAARPGSGLISPASVSRARCQGWTCRRRLSGAALGCRAPQLWAPLPPGL